MSLSSPPSKRAPSTRWTDAATRWNDADTTTGRNLENVRLVERSQSGKPSHCVIPFTCKSTSIMCGRTEQHPSATGTTSTRYDLQKQVAVTCSFASRLTSCQRPAVCHVGVCIPQSSGKATDQGLPPGQRLLGPHRPQARAKRTPKRDPVHPTHGADLPARSPPRIF